MYKRQEISEDELDRRASSNIFQSFTHNTITSLPELKAQLAIIREQGFAVDNSEHNVEIGCIASAIKDSRAKPLAAVSVSGSAEKILGENASNLARLVKECAKRISFELGYVYH